MSFLPIVRLHIKYFISSAAIHIVSSRSQDLSTMYILPSCAQDVPDYTYIT